MPLFKQMRFKVGDTVYLSRSKTFHTNPPTIIPYHAQVKIILVDKIFRTYDIEYNDKVFTDFSDKDFE